MQKFPFYQQQETKDCGPTCLRMIAKFYGKNISVATIRTLAETTREGSSLAGISEAAEKLGFHTLGVGLDYAQFSEEAPLPALVHWAGNHFVVVHKVSKGQVHVADPAHGLLTYSPQEFRRSWIGAQADVPGAQGVVLLLEPLPAFYEQPDEPRDTSYGGRVVRAHVGRHRRFFLQLLIGLVAASGLQLLLPFLTQSIVDVGIKNQDLGFVYLVLGAQLFLFIGRTSLEIIRSWILLHLSTRINVALISDFFIKLMRLPIGYFDTRLTGDILQRIHDHHRIEQLLTASSLNTLFSVVNLGIFGAVLAWYNGVIFLLFGGGLLLYFGWISLFLRSRKNIDYKRFAQVSAEQSKVMELIGGMQEIKLHNAERQKRWSWEYLQARLFRLEVRSLRLEQMQTVGANFINELKNILITTYAATLVIQGNLTLGMMLAVAYIIGQLNSPVLQLVSFAHSLQDARIALERLAEIHDKPDEEPATPARVSYVDPAADLVIQNLSFRYAGAVDSVLHDINLVIPARKVTAFVGASGSGKTTLLKLLLKFYEPTAGSIALGGARLSTISQQAWRAHFGVVMQEGYIFNDTIAGNVALGDDTIDYQRLVQAVEVANIRDFCEGLPQSYNTRIGGEGLGMSTGQKQRLLIARAVYKSPDFLFFDEATSALDARNERVIMENLQAFYRGKTAVIIAHRLSTVKNADQIVVLDQGSILEVGTHRTLVQQRGAYYNLVKNQLDLEQLHHATGEEVLHG
ncbi:peptidase domain-containing ABC transporter [Hymenobacter elongatus]|uniref:Peptidase domain-containing ABC transporter n=1 Tax=Hymenobacter elongatus TaxID=877208 RepID=A0A4Z0PEN3_9BACT|nr:peptidase domain-containing ABC transporter [Hymenobacter elongatus]TGE12626.1 peptidase domain-containing ABC transporter [Hymenobacter elongatus]